MENLNAETVKKALECCKTPLINDCKECPYNINGNDYVGCVNNLVGDALALINQLTEDVERVRKQCGEIIVECDERDAERLKQVAELTKENEEVKANWQKLKESHESACEKCRAEFKRLADESKKWEQAYDCMHSACRELSDKCDRLTEENERLREHIKEGIDLAKQIPEMLNEVSRSTVRKMQERLNEHSRKMHSSDFSGEYWCKAVMVETIVQIAKEMLEGKE